ncbi:DinB family protein [Streptomyces smyrnaeus]|uniref:DinB family protein n=1 Tax=Streptomyces smyrnaeus TaxID=1387713 RepID=UPI0033E8595C
MTSQEEQPADLDRTARPARATAGARATDSDQYQRRPVGAVSGLPLPQGNGSERQLLEQWLDFQRATLAAKCEGLSDEQLRTVSAPPSDLTLLRLLRHMTDVERHWFRFVFGEQDATPARWTADAPDDGSGAAGAGTGAETLAAWQREVERARRSATGRTLDAVGTDPRRPTWIYSLRWIHLHMIGEYARHNGHADLLRERIDGATGF